MSITSPKYAASASIAITLAGLASSTGRLAGRSSAVVSNVANRYADALVGGKASVGSTPTAGKSIEVWVWGAWKDTPAYPDVIDGSDAAKTFGDDGAKMSALKLAAVIATDATSDQTYYVSPFSVAVLFGGLMPTHWGLFITHDTGVAFNASGGNHEFAYTGVTYETV